MMKNHPRLLALLSLSFLVTSNAFQQRGSIGRKSFRPVSTEASDRTIFSMTAHAADTAPSSWTSQVDDLPAPPKLLVFDLDNTLWTPELYQIRKRNVPTVDKDIRLFDDARAVLEFLATGRLNVRLALASRTSKTQWAQHLLDNFRVKVGSSGETVAMRSLFTDVEIVPGSKKKHFANLRDATGFAYSEMLFFDDDARMNLGEISQLGVLCCHTPRGLTLPHFVKALEKYSELKDGHDASHWMGYILNNDNLGIEEEQVEAGQVLQGRIKFFSAQKRFGFVIDTQSNQEFFFHESKVPAGMMVKTGDIVTFESSMDHTGRPSAIILPTGSQPKRGATPSVETVTMPCFSMSQPFAALLLNGAKVVESRKNPMFQDLAPGTQVLLSCGRRDWPDQESYRRILGDMGKTEQQITKLGRLPRGFRKGSVVGILTVGKTWLSSEGERRGTDLQQRVLAPYEGIGRYCTEIREARWLSKPFSARGEPGIYTIDVPKDCL